MLTDAPKVLALDFDGVLCDGLIEYFQTSWRTYCQIWSPNCQKPPDELAPSFYRLRPVVETGWEMPILLRALILGFHPEKILQDWSNIVQQILESEQLDWVNVGRKLDAVRDEWIAADLEGWLNLHRFYPGVVERVRRTLSLPQASLLTNSTTELFVVTTKEGRFANQLLQQQGIQLPQHSIIGKESKRSKHQTLRQLIEASDGEAVSLWFVEDRLDTLQSVQQQINLSGVQLYLADWGYNTEQARESVRNDPDISLLSLDQFNQDFSAWH